MRRNRIEVPGADAAVLGRRWAPLFVGLLTLVLAAMFGTPAAKAQNPVPCERLDMSLDSEFINPICYRRNFAGSDASGWHEHIQGENSRLLITVTSAKTIDSRSYLRGTNINRLYRDFDFPPEMKLLTEPERTGQGFQYATVGVPSSTHCFLFLREERPGYGGYRQMQYGLVCDKSRSTIYALSDVETLLAKIDFAD